MSDAKTPQQEPSMEEILASIRRIISEDGEAGKEPPAMPAAAAAAPAAAPAPAAPAKPAEKPADVLELTEMVSDDGKVTNINAPVAAAPPPPPPPAPPPPAPEPPPVADPGPPAEDLVSATTAAAAAGSLASLQAMAKEPEREYSPPRSLALGDGSLTLEDIVREELRPILKTWLEENLPSMVERLVQKEIKRITRNVDGS